MLAKLKCIEGNLCEDPRYCPQNCVISTGGGGADLDTSHINHNPMQISQTAVM